MVPYSPIYPYYPILPLYVYEYGYKWMIVPLPMLQLLDDMGPANRRLNQKDAKSIKKIRLLRENPPDADGAIQMLD